MPREIEVTGLIAELSPLAEASDKPHVVLDADGTIWSGDVGFDLFGAALRESALRDEARPRLADEAAAIGVSTEGSASAIAERLLAANLEGRYPNGPAFAMMAWSFAGFGADEMRAFAAAVVVRERVARRVFPFVEPLFAWARSAGVRITVCSASPHTVVEAGVAHLGLVEGDVIAVTPAIEQGRLCDRLISGDAPYAEGKVARLDAERPGHTLIAGFGDSAGDAHFLRRASVAVGVRPHAALVELCRDAPNFVLLQG